MDTEKKEQFISRFYGDFDLVVRPIETGINSACLFYLDGMADEERLCKEVLSPLLSTEKPITKELTDLLSIIRFSGNTRFTEEEQDGVEAAAGGDAVLLINEGYYIFPVRKSNSRSVEEPPTSTVIKGPREGFVEDLKSNLVLLRRKLRTNKLILRSVSLGKYSATNVTIAFLKGIASEKTVEEVSYRLSSIEPDGITDSSFIAKLLEKNRYSLFKQVGNSEKVDVIASRLLDGRVAILVDGSPIVLTVPFILMEDFEDIQDRYKMASIATFSRYIRLFGLFFALLLPAAFVAVQSHQYQILPLQLMITVLNATGGIPFSPTLEMIIALLLFEVLTEAGIRMPKPVGLALSVVGAIVLGQTAVEAGFLSSLTVLIVAMSGIGVYTVPDQAGVIGCLRILLVISAGMLGIYGILLAFLAIMTYLGNFSSFGIPYLSPLAPIKGQLKDVLIKKSLTDLSERTISIENLNRNNGRSS